ncbi:YggS family pyridoxal phosphate-dependent enzyme [Teredinibacter sp. KSP-S5-2]|uniref:YggS family pyridoxal phosphate-dependent enzyme n=1 Tax=Teredinibacter sp. KSP-S5-2 TaxID=3034506 RepID=UPI002934F6DA|nr:YggS family pyridoxal phosphate-dependent enzyme [Teredinibacter sp. KSP-S5-2]WNO07595.1 YggS family pyridoxal phosphate-dependent enzyme [Teredinibacter sp. KSP-S5-2]
MQKDTDTENTESIFDKEHSLQNIQKNLLAVQHQIESTCKTSNRSSKSVRLLPVSKTFSSEYIRLAYAIGCTTFGENKVQEAQKKYQETCDIPDLHWAIIGHLQTNKAKYVARFASEFHALDSLHLAKELDRRLQMEGRSLNVYIQVNTSGEKSKYGLEPDHVEAFIKQLPVFSSLQVKGLMTLAINNRNAEQIRMCFSTLRNLRNQLRQKTPAGIELNELSMGMSGDYKIAIKEGATVLRIGQAIFGARSLPDSYYWPK